MTNLILRPSTFAELDRFAQVAAKSKMVPTAYQNKPEDIMLAIQMGSELGLAPMQSLQGIAVINSRPSVWGDALIGLCRSSAACEDIAEKIEGDGDNRTAYCVAKRKGASPVTGRFSVADAKRANLWGKQGPWAQYPDRMLQMRARAFALRDAFPDVLKGLHVAEEVRDIPAKADEFAGPTLDATAEIVPEPQPEPKRTLGQFLDALEIRLREAATWEEVSKIAQDPEVLRAQDLARNGQAERLSDMLDAARERTMSDVGGEGEAP